MLSLTAPTLRNLKEAPESSGRLNPLPVQTSANTGSWITATEAEVRPFTAPERWPESAPLPESFRHTLPADNQHFLTYGLRPALPKALLPRDRKPAPEPVRHFNRTERESDARNLSDLPQRNQLCQPMTGF
ncbi:hypothetical protein [Hafnia paralvei]|jgi:hypothetical protein|uniref:hypothetical protein n=1 Tax=Hafnia paralvei TaxID=546367 RepID=UPI00187D1996|nr:hypothetical protein [Hafnia paralvei]